MSLSMGERASSTLILAFQTLQLHSPCSLLPKLSSFVSHTPDLQAFQLVCGTISAQVSFVKRMIYTRPVTTDGKEEYGPMFHTITLAGNGLWNK